MKPPSLQKARRVELLSVVGARLAQYGFAPRPVGQSFYRNELTNPWSCHVGFIKHKNDFHAIGDVAIRLELAERLIQSVDRSTGQKVPGRMFSMGIELGNANHRGQMRWSVENDADVAKAAEGLTFAFVSIGLPILERLSNMDECLRILSKGGADDDESLCPVPERRYKLAIALACVLGKSELVDELVSRGEGVLATGWGGALERFQEFARAVRGLQG